MKPKRVSFSLMMLMMLPILMFKLSILVPILSMAMPIMMLMMPTTSTRGRIRPVERPRMTLLVHPMMLSR